MSQSARSNRHRTAPLPVVVAGLAATLLAAACSPAASSPASQAPGGASTPTAASASAGATTSTGGIPAATAAASTSSPATGGAILTCAAPAAATPSQTEGPYYKAGAPHVTSLVTSGVTGTRLTLTGHVVDTSCRPLGSAKVDIWQADAGGAYDNSGYRLRGYVLSDATGRYAIETIVPGQYPGRTEHIHVKVTPAGGATLTTQLYFPDQAASNAADRIYAASLLLTMTPVGDGWTGTFTFVLAG